MARAGGRKKKSRKSQPTSLVERLRSVAAGFLLGSPVDEGTSDRLQEIKGLSLIAASLWLLIAMVSFYAPPTDPLAEGRNWGGEAGYYLAHGAFLVAGWSSYLIVVLGLAWGVVILARKEVSWPALRLFGALCLVLSVSFMSQLAFGGGAVDEHLYTASERAALGLEASSRMPYGPGGWLAHELVQPTLVPKFGVAGLWILLGLLSAVSFMLATEMAFYPALAAAGEWLEERRAERDESLLVSVGRWFGGVMLGLWDFLRGADLVGATEAAGGKGKSKSKAKGKGKTKAKSKAKAKGKSGGKKAAAEAQPSFSEWEEDEEPEEEWAADGEGVEWEYVDAEEDEDVEWEYVDDPAAELEDDEEYEYEEVEEEDDPEAEYEEYEDDEEYEYEEEDEEVVLTPAAGAAKPRPPVRTVASHVPTLETPLPPQGEWKFPPLDLLAEPAPALSGDGESLEVMASKLENTLQSFRVEAQVVGAQVGPAVTLFELTVSQGTRMNAVANLSQEISAALKAKSVRIIAPIPGRSTIGVEVPNDKRRTVRLRELIHKKAYDTNYMALPMFIGMDAEGTPVVEDLSKMPHLLIAGTTGSGKSVCINTILTSLLLTRTPHEVKLVLVDPKMVELEPYSRVPHLMLPVVTDARQATQVLNWLVEKMESRYELLKDAKVRNIKSYNKLGEDKLREVMGDDFNEERTPRQLPYIVVVIDEMADLMMVSKKEAEGAITRLAQKSRAVGIHVIVATQRPSTDVITGVLKGNLPTRIAFRVASKIDSRVILDAQGAEKLLGGGDMLYTPPGSSSINRVQGAFLEDEELTNIVDFVCEESAPSFSQELIQSATGTAPAGQVANKSGPDDPLWNDAVRVVLESKRGSASLLQRALSVGYTRASRLIDLMSEEGILGPHIGSKSREILLTLEEWDAMTGADTVHQGTSDE
jgi:S-DNA-T family DNA segregation ATPase FtsK/SpoIIIE